MAIHVDKLDSLVLTNASASDEITIITGYFSIDILEKIARTGIPTSYYYGMYLKNGISQTNYDELKRLEATYPTFKAYIPLSYHVHTKCYIFKNNGTIINTLVGSANCSSSALSTTANSELLMPVINNTDIAFLDAYAAKIAATAVHFDDPLIFPSAKNITLAVSKPRQRKAPASWKQYTGNPFSAIIPLYCMEKGKPVVQKVDGLNWGNGPHHKKNAIAKEAIIPIRSFIIDHYPTLIPFNGTAGSGSGGKCNRMQKPIDMIWDDGTKMKMVFQQAGPQRPPQSVRTPGSPYRIYPKALTTNSGGDELGKYLRDRMGIPLFRDATYTDLRNYGRDYITLTLNNAGDYELDFHV